MMKRTWMALAIGLGMVGGFATAQAAETSTAPTPSTTTGHPTTGAKTATTATHHRAHHRRSSTKSGTKPTTAGQKMPVGGAPVAK